MPEIRGGFHEVPARNVPELLAEAVRHVWDAPADSVWGDPHGLDAPRVVVVRPDAGPVVEAHGDHVIALDVLRDLPTSPADARCTAGRRTELSVYVASAHRDGGPSRSAPPRTADAR
ncbi:hypothetical protein ACFUJ0_06805 [Streptomyces sp. NPDC057242]|uniref:hypothetical protein n=1 Tax=unclassified Streptomyces TaxID=2593676 RepID=UPI00362559BB